MTLSRRGFLRTTYAAAGAVTLVTAGQTVTPLSGIALLAPRKPDLGPQRLPVNRTAGQARITPEVTGEPYRLVVDGPRPLKLSLAQLQGLDQHEAQLAISCVEGWSSSATWAGVRVRELIAMAGIDPGRRIRVESLEQRGAYRHSVLSVAHAQDERTLLALRVRGEELALDHGYPARLIAPNRPGVMQTKWVHRLVAL
jgi:DMSO/TMAO reductase YedYZ molybdopterin-dependent catalytic subunit